MNGYSSSLLSGHVAVIRKPRQYLNETEKWIYLQSRSQSIRQRAEYLNNTLKSRHETFSKDIEVLKNLNCARLNRTRDLARTTLAELSTSKEKSKRNVTNFEYRLKKGNNSPLFSSEYQRINRKQATLSHIRQALGEPNNYPVVSKLSEELKHMSSMQSRFQSSAKTFGSEARLQKIANDQSYSRATKTSTVTVSDSTLPETIPNGRSLPPLIKTRNYPMVHRKRVRVESAVVSREKHARERVIQAALEEKQQIKKKLYSVISSNRSSAEGLVEDPVKMSDIITVSTKNCTAENPLSGGENPLPKIRSSRPITKKETNRRNGKLSSTNEYLLLPQIRVDKNMVAELKHHRMRHKHQSTHLPRLP